jgi:hypothetical protein
MRLEELVLLVNDGVKRRLNDFEEFFIGCGYLAQESSAGADWPTRGESESGAIRGVSPSTMNTADSSTRAGSGSTQTRSIIGQSTYEQVISVLRLRVKGE